MTQNAAPTDIEIYVKTKDIAVLISWLFQQFNALTKSPDKPFKPKNQHFETGHGRQRLQIQVLEQPIPGYCCMTIAGQTGALPWLHDIELAEHFVKDTGLTVRCSDGQWFEGADPDAWVEVSSHGRTNIRWLL